MSGYLLSVVGTILISAVLTAIVPEGKTAPTIKHIARLACLAIIISPIPKFFQKNVSGTEINGNFFTEKVIQTDSSFIQYYSELRMDHLETAIQRELFDKFSINITIEIECEGSEEYTGELIVKRIRLLETSEMTEEKKMVVWEYLKQNYCSEVLIE